MCRAFFPLDGDVLDGCRPETKMAPPPTGRTEELNRRNSLEWLENWGATAVRDDFL